MRTYARTRARTCARTRAPTHARMHARTHARTRTQQSPRASDKRRSVVRASVKFASGVAWADRPYTSMCVLRVALVLLHFRF